jgi:cytochrome c556
MKIPFRFVISGDLDDFAAFCAIIRGDDPNDDAKVQAMTARLKKSADALAKAEQADATKTIS